MIATCSESDSRFLARVLCEATREVLFALYEDRIERRAPGVRVQVDVGSGRATYNRRQSVDRHLISRA